MLHLRCKDKFKTHRSFVKCYTEKTHTRRFTDLKHEPINQLDKCIKLHNEAVKVGLEHHGRMI